MKQKIELFQKYKLTTGGFDQDNNLTPFTILDIFQDIAGLHAAKLNATYNKSNSNIIWLLLRNKFEIIKSINKPVEVIVRTWPIKPKRIDYDRDYEIYDLDNNLLIKGSSKWCLFNLETNLIVRDLINFDGIYLIERTFPNDLKKINIPQDLDEEYLGSRTIPNSYIDVNNHVNNAKYTYFIMDNLSLAKDTKVQSFEINYHKELKKDDVVHLFQRKINNLYYIYGKMNDELIFSSMISIK